MYIITNPWIKVLVVEGIKNRGVSKATGGRVATVMLVDVCA